MYRRLFLWGEGEAGVGLDGFCGFAVGEYDGGWFVGGWDVGYVAVGEGDGGGVVGSGFGVGGA